jgi:hypothetical protein
MHLKSLCLIALTALSEGTMADQLVLEDAAKQLLKDTANETAPAEAGQAVDSANKSVEKAKNQKESMEHAPATLKEQAAGAAGEVGASKPSATDAVKEGGVPEEAKSAQPQKARKSAKRKHR